MIYLGFLLHFYQPSQQVDHVFEQVCDECYRPLLHLVNDRKDARFTFDINWSLTERWLREDRRDLLDYVSRALRTQRIEMTSSAASHAILPLIPRSERFRQILLNDERNRRAYGDFYRPVGFFPPEMAYGPEVADVLSLLDYRWTITDDASFISLYGDAPGRVIVTVDNLPVLFRSRMWSNRVSMDRDARGRPFGGEAIARWLLTDLDAWFEKEDGYLILAMDAETFGRYVPGYIESFVTPFLDTLAGVRDRLRLVHIQEIVRFFPRQEVGVPPGSWSTSREDFWNGDFFPLWRDEASLPYDCLWELTQMAHQGLDRVQRSLDEALGACIFGWSSRRPDPAPPLRADDVQAVVDVIRSANPLALGRAEEIQRELQGWLLGRGEIERS